MSDEKSESEAEPTLADLVAQQDTDPAPAPDDDAPAAEGDEKKPDDDGEKKPEKEAYSAVARREARAKRQALREIQEAREAFEKERAEFGQYKEGAAFARALANETSMLKRAKMAGIDIEKLAEEYGLRAPEDHVGEHVEKALSEREKHARAARERQQQQRDHEEAVEFLQHVDGNRADMVAIARDLGWDGNEVMRQVRGMVQRGLKANTFDDLANAFVEKFGRRAAEPPKAQERSETKVRTLTQSSGGGRGSRSVDDDDDERSGDALRKIAMGLGR